MDYPVLKGRKFSNFSNGGDGGLAKFGRGALNRVVQ